MSHGTSRREFLATSALGLIGMAARGMPAHARAAGAADAELLYLGTYTEGGTAGGIHLARFDTRSGALHHVQALNGGPNPSFLAIHPHGRTLYAVNETTERMGRPDGGVTAFAIDAETGMLTVINEQASGGAAPCYVSVDREGRAVLVANYVGGSVTMVPLRERGALGLPANVVQHIGSGPVRDRQQSAHAHCIVADPSNRFALACDLGVDRVMLYRLDLDDGHLRHVAGGDAALRPGAGPRHLAFHPSQPLVYVANELDSTVTTLRFDADRGVLTPVTTGSTLPAGWNGTSYVADIHVAPDGRALYVSNRGHDSIAVFSVSSTGTLTLVQHQSTGGNWPRNFSLDTTGRWLLTGNQRSGDVVVLARDPDSGRLSPTGSRLAVPRVACVRFRAHHGVTT